MIVVVKFVSPVEINVDKLWEGAPDFVGSARTDPDGSAIRLALARKATPNVMMAGERLFVDLSARHLERSAAVAARGRHQGAGGAREGGREAVAPREAALAAKKRPPIRVRASTQPTFTRYVFELPEGAGVSTILNKERLTLNFDAGLSFDLADAKVAVAANITSIAQKVDGESTVVEFGLIGDADVHSFREERNYVVDIGFVAKQDSEPKRDMLKPEAQQPATVPSAVSRRAEIMPPTSQDIIKEAGDSGARRGPAPAPAASAQPQLGRRSAPVPAARRYPPSNRSPGLSGEMQARRCAER